MEEITSEAVNAVGAANNEFDRCNWARQHAIVAVKNGGEEAAPGENEGNNCLLVSILQHATGNYADRFHASMTKTLREAIVAKYPTIHYSDPLHDDTEAIEWLRQTVNALYDRDLQFVSVMMAPGAKAEDVAPFISHTSDGGSEPALIWAKGTHYEALVSSASAPASEHPSRLQQLEQRTGAVQIRLQEASSPTAMNEMVADLNQCLRNEMIEIRNLIQAGSRSVISYSSALIDATAFDGRPASNSSPDAVRRVLNQIGGSHSQALQRKANAELESRFAEKIQCHKLSIPDQYHHLLAVESEFRERPQPGASWSSLVP